MNSSPFEITWKQLRGQLREWWPNLSNEDLEQVAGNFEQLIRLLQEKYRYTPQHAQAEFDQRRGSLRQIIERRVEQEFSRRLAKIEARQKIHDFT